MASVQHVTKASSDELLKKFAQAGSEKEFKKEFQIVVKRRRRSSIGGDGYCESPGSGRRMSWTDRKTLLPVGKRRQAGVMKRLGIGRSSRARAAIGAMEKTWRRTVEGALKVFMEKNRHQRLINDPAY